MERAWDSRTWRVRHLDRPFWVGVAAYTLLVFARRTFLSANATAAIWPAAGIMAAAFLLSPRSRWKWLLLIGVVENVAANAAFGFSSRTLLSIPEAALLAWLIRRTCPPSLNFAEPRTMLLFIVKALTPACLISATAMYLLPNGDHPGTVSSATRWFIGHALGAVIAVPTMVTLLRPRRFRAFDRPAWELGAACLAMLAYGAMLFHGRDAVLSLAMFPMAMFLAFRYGPVGAATGSVLMTGLALLHIYAGVPGPRPTSYAQVQWVQMFVAVMFLTSLPAAGALTSLHRTRQLLARRSQTARLARRRADEAATAKTRFLANMSHEIRTPLNGVIGLADGLSRTPLRPDQREMVDMIQSSGQGLNGILSDVLDLARADAGSLKLSPRPFAVAEAVTAASRLFGGVAEAKGVAFRLDCAIAPDAVLVGDALRLRQIISNLISNAVKFTETGEVAVRASVEPAAEPSRAELTVEVSDTGPGFDEAVKARLFRRFEQADTSIARRFGGTGLGLAISRELAELMGGEIACRSQSGQGATFVLRVALPLAEAHAAPNESALSEPARSETPSLGRERLKVLLAEDHPVNQRVIQAILGDAADLTLVEDGQAAVQAFSAGDFDLVLMDTQMPGMDGLTATRTIRALEARRGLGRTPIVSLTADAMPHQVKAALAAGADRHLAKPITAAALMAVLVQALERKAA